MPYSEKQLTKHKKILLDGVEIKVELIAHETKPTKGFVKLKEFSESEKSSRAFKFLFGFVGAAFVAVILPPHIIWFVSLILVGVVGYFAKKNQKAAILGGEGACSNCNAFQILEKSPAEFPMVHYCSECNRRNDVYKEGEIPPEELNR